MRAFCTVVTPSHLSWARALAISLQSSQNVDPLYVLFVSEAPVDCASLPPNLHIVYLSQLTRQPPCNIYWYFDPFELCNALKPFIVESILQMGFEQVMFLDSDLYIVSSFEPIWSRLQDVSLLLTPHHLSPPNLKLKYTNEVAIADMGIFNGGFLAWRRGIVALKILEWMCTRFPIYGFNDRHKGMFVDQKLLPLLLQYFPEDIQVLRDPVLNIAFWNSHERQVEHYDGIYSINEEPVIFFHMSGFRLSHPSTPCSYLPQSENSAILAEAPWMLTLLGEYRKLLQSCVDDHTGTSNCPFKKFNGITLTPGLRRILFQKGKLEILDLDVLRIIFLETVKKVKRRLLPYRNA
jgi:hypothetical protein